MRILGPGDRAAGGSQVSPLPVKGLRSAQHGEARGRERTACFRAEFQPVQLRATALAPLPNCGGPGSLHGAEHGLQQAPGLGITSILAAIRSQPSVPGLAPVGCLCGARFWVWSVAWTSQSSEWLDAGPLLAVLLLPLPKADSCPSVPSERVLQLWAGVHQGLNRRGPDPRA